MKLIVQIPCLNEEATLPETLRSIPRVIAGVDTVEILVIDDGSTDRTAVVARELGVDHIVRFTRRKGLAAGFMAGLDAALRQGADIIVNTDADNQYPNEEIPALIAPILRGEADMVIGDRGVGDVAHFSWAKRRLQMLGSWVVRKVSGTKVPDTTSGFRALTRDAALRINIASEFTYTLESIIQAGKKRLAVAHLPITSRQTRPSRLFTSTWEYVKRSAATILRIYATYEPLKVFMMLGSALLLAGLLLGLRYSYYWMMGEIRGHVQSAILAVLLLILGFQTLLWGIMADLIGNNRRLIEDLLYRIRRIELQKGAAQETVESDSEAGHGRA
ncbi:MAG: glycosyltransferase family 2 protein [Vicinamibacteria bacterium]|jgi:glycosyltransferase involved in cell wall biosynthesis|nr:glycosyltransferase family 2 protein [Vicinamibacteria bacterium]